MKSVLGRFADPCIQALILVCVGLLLAFTPDLYVFMLARAFLWPWSVVFLLFALVSAGMRRWWPAAAALVALLLTWMAQTTGPTSVATSNGTACRRVAPMNL